MLDSIPGIEILEDEQSSGHLLESRLLTSLGSSLPQGKNSSFVLSARDSGEAVVGGLAASTSYGWLLVKVLWIDEKYRRLGLGRALMRRAEQKGIDVGCHGAWLDTSNLAAMEFYRKLGYENFGKLSNAEGHLPENHNRWFMKKSLHLR
ncbi:MAG: GNAT family N-acetyltransferase [Granulosicoccus sp.]|nr:GNAT family N-acetyltransferase [Granulosicoccus sp.]